MKLTFVILGLMVSAALPTMAAAQTFSCITNNSGACTTDSGAQSYLSWEMKGDQLTVYNKSGLDNSSFIEQIYFAGDGAQNISLYSQSSGVVFQSGATPALLPGEKSISFATVTSWSAVHQGAGNDGVDAGQWISFLMPKASQSRLASSPFQFAVHLQGIGEQGFSESLVASVSPVPEPETFAMLLAGLGLIGSVVRRRKQINLPA